MAAKVWIHRHNTFQRSDYKRMLKLFRMGRNASLAHFCPCSPQRMRCTSQIKGQASNPRFRSCHEDGPDIFPEDLFETNTHSTIGRGMQI